LRQALELSMTTAPAAATLGAHSLLVPPPALKSAMSMPEKSDDAMSSTVICSSPHGSCLPALRAEAK
jgi:hypothetical protein